MLRGEARQLFAPLERERGALRVLKRRNDIDEARTRPLDGALELVDAHPVLVASDGDERRVVRLEHLQRGDVGGVLHHDRVTRVEQHARDQVDALL